MSRALFLFSRDLRLADHAGLSTAVRSGDVVPALILEPAAIERLKRSPRRASFFASAVQALARDIAGHGGRLIVRTGPLASAAKRLARDAAAETVVWSLAYDAATVERQRALQSGLEESGFRAIGVHDAPAVSPEETAAARTDSGGLGYRAFTAYYAAWERAQRTRERTVTQFARLGIASDDVPTPEDFGGNVDAAASEAGAGAALDAFASAGAVHYLAARSEPAAATVASLGASVVRHHIGSDGRSSKIDARRRDPFLVTEEVLSLRAFTRSLARRDFFLQLAWFFEVQPDSPLQEKMKHFVFARTHPDFDRWRDGRTGFPLVDAGVRELHATGWMHPRVRQIAASFLCFDLGVDWRAGRDEWDRYLIEDEPALASGNWQWSAGVGADLAAYPRIFNPQKQARAVDPHGTYVRRWIPELADVPTAELFERDADASRNQLSLALFGDRTYPSPMLDHERAARAFLRRYEREIVSQQRTRERTRRER